MRKPAVAERNCKRPHEDRVKAARKTEATLQSERIGLWRNFIQSEGKYPETERDSKREPLLWTSWKWKSDFGANSTERKSNQLNTKIVG